MTTIINEAFLKLSKRAETYDRDYLLSTFVNVGPLITLLSNTDHQVIYGRRGTGKTHALSYLAGHLEMRGEVVVTVDMRTLGSSGGIYADPELPLSERATRLLVDTYNFIHSAIYEYVIEHDKEINLAEAGPVLDQFANAITEVYITGNAQFETSSAEKSKMDVKKSLGLNLESIAAELSTTNTIENDNQYRLIQSGDIRHRVHFGSTATSLKNLGKCLSPKRIWILLDEWSEVPLDIQPYLADLIRRSVFPLKEFTVKIAAIELRSRFRIYDEEVGHIGIELGAASSPSLNLDEFMVFDNNSEKAKSFFKDLLFKHTISIIKENKNYPQSSDTLLHTAFTQLNAFDELVKAAEGVPRDMLNVLAFAAEQADDRSISIPDIRSGARKWYNRAKEQAVMTKPNATELLRWIIDEVIGHRRARAFLLQSDVRDPLIDFLFDARVLHVIKHNISGQDMPGKRFNVYCIDYGCYVELISTSKAPLGLFEVINNEKDEFVEVPVNDYRSIRRAILNLDKFYKKTL